MKEVLVLGGGGFIGEHLVVRLRSLGHFVRVVDLKQNAFTGDKQNDLVIGDLRDPKLCEKLAEESYDWIFQLAADMGGAGYVFSGEHDADIMHNSALINLNVLNAFKEHKTTTLFYASSACIYPEENQMDPDSPLCSEESAYPANPDSEYGWEKLFSERLYSSYARNYGLNVRIARFHNVYGPKTVFQGGREKAPAALCRKIATAKDGESIDVWGDGKQSRSFLFIDDCLDAMLKLMESDHSSPINIGSEEMVTINELAQRIINISAKNLQIHNVTGPEGVRGRCSHNEIIEETIGWKPKVSLNEGLEHLYQFISSKV